MLETLVHFGVAAKAGSNRYLIEILLPADVFDRRDIRTADELLNSCPDWDAIPAAEVSQQIGDAWLAANTAAVLQVPSAIVPYSTVPDVNYLLNPAHPDMKLVQVKVRQKVIYDARISAEAPPA
jgi:RES domain-containing protein